jgi:flagellar biosynthesis/type III secretory pathway chaperone
MSLPQPQTKNGPFEGLIQTASRLTALLDRENVCLEKCDIAGVAALHEEKQSLTRAYCLHVHELKQEPAKLAVVTQVVRDEVKKVMTRFDEVCSVNERRLKAIRDANDRVMKVIIDAANKQAPRVSGYSRTGAAAKPYGSSGRVPVPPPVAINRTL